MRASSPWGASTTTSSARDTASRQSLGLVDPPEQFDIDPREVAEVFEVPLEFVLERANYRRERMKIKQFDRRFYVLPYADYYIWGATAAILVNLREALSE